MDTPLRTEPLVLLQRLLRERMLELLQLMLWKSHRPTAMTGSLRELKREQVWAKERRKMRTEPRTRQHRNCLTKDRHQQQENQHTKLQERQHMNWNQAGLQVPQG